MAEDALDEVTPMDDICMKRLFDDRPDLAATVLRATLGDPGIELETAQTERHYANYGRHDARLDVLCCGPGAMYDLELQADPGRAWPQRAAFYEGMLATKALARGAGYPDMDRVEVVFVTNGDALGLGEPLVGFEWANLEKQSRLGTDIHITYVDASYNGFGDTELGRVAHDLLCPDPDEMLIPAFAEAMREVKESMKGDEELETYTQRIRREALEEGLAEGEEKGMEKGRQENRAELIARAVSDGDIPLDKIAKLFGITVDEVRSHAKTASLSA